eukprot:TRINITY_DN19495_c0_g2_i1.p1 TRINITY_DN19495_c0_g2~~TRINITY_DN19495_c0_g2_i1.p1  ORF type:complete len:326 (+),score=6.83 TRINITY_DN19495_c0_g2_i1:60-1037(+)
MDSEPPNSTAIFYTLSDVVHQVLEFLPPLSAFYARLLGTTWNNWVQTQASDWWLELICERFPEQKQYRGQLKGYIKYQPTAIQNWLTTRKYGLKDFLEVVKGDNLATVLLLRWGDGGAAWDVIRDVPTSITVRDFRVNLTGSWRIGELASGRSRLYDALTLRQCGLRGEIIVSAHPGHRRNGSYESKLTDGVRLLHQPHQVHTIETRMGELGTFTVSMDDKENEKGEIEVKGDLKLSPSFSWDWAVSRIRKNGPVVGVDLVATIAQQENSSNCTYISRFTLGGKANITYQKYEKKVVRFHLCESVEEILEDWKERGVEARPRSRK